MEAQPAVGIREAALAWAWVLSRLMPRTYKVVDTDSRVKLTLAVSLSSYKTET